MAPGRSRSAADIRPDTAAASTARGRTPPRRARRRLIALSVLVALVLLGWWWVDRQLEPQRLAATVLAQAGKSLQLDLRFSGEPEYAFRPEPRLLLPQLAVRDPVTNQVILSARRAEVSLPWTSVTGDSTRITRIELDQPLLDLPGLRAWQARRPPRPFELPTLTHGLEVRAGRVRDHAFSIAELDLELPRLQAGLPAEATAAGLYLQGDTRVRARLHLTAATPGLASRYTLSGSGTLERSPAPLPFKLQARGQYRFAEGEVLLSAAPLAITAASPLPTATGDLQLSLGERLDATFAGQLQEWPEDWPSLPSPLSEDARQLPLRLRYLGSSDLGDPLALQVEKAATRLDASVRVAELSAWASRPDASPLPPLTGQLRTPKMDLGGIELEGVQVELREDEALP